MNDIEFNYAFLSQVETLGVRVGLRLYTPSFASPLEAVFSSRFFSRSKPMRCIFQVKDENSFVKK